MTDRYATAVAFRASLEQRLRDQAMATGRPGWLLLDRAGSAAQAALVAMIAAGDLEPVELAGSDWGRIHRLVTTYADLSLD